MEQSSTPRTTRDALTIELMGDIGRLDDQIKALPHTMNEALSPTLGALVMASKEAQQSITQLGAEQKTSLQNFSASEKYAISEALKKVLREEAGKALASAARELESSARIHQEAVNRETSQRWQWLGIAFVIGIMGGGLGIYSSHLLYNKLNSDQLAYGKALNLVWDNLDTKTQKRIMAAVKPE